MQKAEVALMFSDIPGYSRLLELDEHEALELLSRHNEISQQVISEYNGNLVKRLDDSILASFASVNDAYLCALDFLQRLKDFNQNKDKPRRLLVSIGLHKGKADVRNNVVIGEQVNVAARLQAMAEPGSICMSNAMYSSISKMIDMKVVEYRDVEIDNLPGNHNVYKTLSIYHEEFKIGRPVVHEKSDFRYKIKELHHIPGRGASFISTAITALFFFAALVTLAAGIMAQRTETSLSGILSMWLQAPVLYLSVIPASLFFAAIYARRKMRAVFDDVREVDRILSYIMSQLGYRQPVHAKGFMLFRPSGNFLVLGMRKFRARVDGNTIILQGPYLYMSRLIKMLKHYEQTGKTDIV